MSYLLPNYKRQEKEFTTGTGTYIYDIDGQEYLDFTSGIGVQNLGHRPQKVEDAVKEQLEMLWHVPNLYLNQKQEKVAKLLGEGYNYQAFFCNSGTEANEAAIKLARKASGRSKIVSFNNSFHGRTYGAMTATGQDSIHEGFFPLIPDFDYFTYNHIPDLEKLDNSVGAVILELVQGEGGIVPANEEWVRLLAKKCREESILIIVDEVQTGIGRTGTLFAFEQYDLFPDIVSLAKGLGNGIPVGAILARDKYAQGFGPGSHGSTFGGNLLAMVAAEKVVEIVRETSFLADVQEKSTLAFGLLKSLTHLPNVKDVRGKGLMIGIQVSEEELAPIMNQCENKGLLVLRAGKDVIRLLPPLSITTDELTKGITILKNVLETVNA